MPKLPMGDVGPCVVIWDYNEAAAGTPICLGPYLGKVELRTVDSVSDVQEEGYGEAPVDAVAAGTVVELDIPMTRSDLAALEHTIVYEKMGARSGPILTIKNWAGCDMYANAKQVLIVPICNNVPNTDPHAWTLLYKCHPYRDYALGWDRAEQRTHMVKFKVFPNQDSGFCGDYGTEGVESGAQAIVGIC